MAKKTRRRWMAVASAIVIAGIAGSWTLTRGNGTAGYRTIKASKGDLLLTVSATGNPNAVVTVQVGSQVSGNIQALYADFNSHVTKGQLVARIDPALFDARVQQARATLDAAKTAVVNASATISAREAEIASAQANVASADAGILRAKSAQTDAKSKYERRISMEYAKILSKEDLETAKSTLETAVGNLQAADAEKSAAVQGVVAANAQLEVAKTMLDSAKAQVKQYEAALSQAETDLAHTYITAPVDGIVVARHMDVGQTVAASLQAPTIFDIAQDLTKMQVDTNVSEADIGKVQVGQAASFTVDAYAGQAFHGNVREIRKAPINVQNVITYDVVIAVSNPDLKLFPGMTATVKIVTGQRANVLRAPNAALRFKPAEAVSARTTRSARTQTVYVLRDNKTVPVNVTTGATDGSFTEITGGELASGDALIIAATQPGKTASSNSSNPLSGGSRGPRI